MKKLSLMLIAIILPLQLASDPVSLQIYTKRDSDVLKKIGIIGTRHTRHDKAYSKAFKNVISAIKESPYEAELPQNITALVEIKPDLYIFNLDPTDLAQERRQSPDRDTLMYNLTTFYLLDHQNTKPFIFQGTDGRPSELLNLNPLIKKAIYNVSIQYVNPIPLVQLKKIKKIAIKTRKKLCNLIKKLNTNAFNPLHSNLTKTIEILENYSNFMDESIGNIFFINIDLNGQLRPIFQALQDLLLFIADVYFLEKIINDQIENDYTLLMCGHAHAIPVGNYLEKLGYSISTKHSVFTESEPVLPLNQSESIHPKEFAAFLTNFLGICNYCCKPTRSRCRYCKQARYCNEECKTNDRENHACFCKRT